MIYSGSRSVSIENHAIRVTVFREGGHIAEMLHKTSAVNPLWAPTWNSIEPSAFNPVAHPEYSAGVDARLLAGLMGHNICLDVFGVPSIQEFVAGLGVLGEAPVAAYQIEHSADRPSMTACLPLAHIRFAREITLRNDSVEIEEMVQNLPALDRPIGWPQHFTLGPPFLECSVTHFKMSATKIQSLRKRIRRGRIRLAPHRPCGPQGLQQRIRPPARPPGRNRSRTHAP